MPISPPKVAQSSSVFLGETVTQIRVTVSFTGTIRFYVTADGGSNWEEISSIVSGTEYTHTFTNTGTDVRWRCVGLSGAKLLNTYDSYGQYSTPMVKIEVV